MTLDPHTLSIILAMTAAALFCRFSGYAFMRFVPLSGRVRAGLAAMPLAVMLAIIIPPALRGGLPEAAGIGATGLVVLLRGPELLAVIAGVAVVALLRGLGI